MSQIYSHEKNDDDLFRSMFRHATVGIVMVDARGSIIQVNDHANRIFGYVNEELVGQSIEVLVPREAHHRHVKYRDTYFEKPEPRPMGIGRELYGIKKNGDAFPVEVSLSNAIKGKERVAIAFVSDISIRQDMLYSLKENERQLQEYSDRLEQKVIERTKELTDSENRLLEAQRMASLGYWEFDLTNQLLSFSAGLPGIVGLPAQVETKVETFSSLIHPDDLSSMVELVKSAIDQQQGREEYSCRILTPGGKTKYIQGYLEKSTDEDTGITKLFGITQDVTTHRKAEQQLARSLKKEREVGNLKSRFVAMASHEFRTPLTSILSSTDLISIHAERMNTTKFDRHLKRIKSSVNNMTSILDDLLSLDKLESGTVSYHPQLVVITELFESVVEEMNLTTTDRQRILMIHQGVHTALLDPQLTRNILINLLSNAIKYSPGDSKIEISSDRKDNQLSISISDQGIGIPESDQYNMFNRFFRASNAESIKGTGLGLTIVKRYLDIMKGEISFVSKEGKGTTFYVEIPQSA